MNVSVTKPDQARPLSKYARKQAERAKGARPPFEFSDAPRPDARPPKYEMPKRLSRDALFGKKHAHKTRATVTHVFTNYAFLKTFDGVELYMDLAVLSGEQRSVLDEGQNIVCAVRFPEGPVRPRVHEVYSITSAGIRRA